MTSAIPVTPSGLPEDLYHSAPIVLVRYTGPSAFAAASIRKSLTAKALSLAWLCAALAFFAPAVRTPIAAPRAATTAPAKPKLLLLPQLHNRKLTEFLLAESSKFQNLGRIRLKVTDVDAQRGVYNLSARFRKRQFKRTGVKVNEAVKLTNGRAAPEIVVGAILPSQMGPGQTRQNRVWGYLSEPRAKPPVGHRRRRHRPVHSAARR